MARVAIVTGGTRGIGEAISLALKDLGMTVAANYAGNDERAREFSDRTGIAAYKWDVGDYDACQAGCAKVAEELGPVDVVVNNAGITRDGTILKMTYQMWKEVMDTNLGGCFNMGADRQYRVDQRPGRPVRPGQLRRRQIGHPRLHQGAGTGRRTRRGDGQRDRAGLYRH
jgi:NAD(P)-dependent dehydrogenase (short-subunit alcohol dehydrogenase family)